MICSNCGKEMGDGAEFCPECGARAEAAGAPKENTNTAQTSNGDSKLEVREDYAELSVMTEKVRKSEKMWSIVGKVFAVLVLLLIGRGIFKSVVPIANGEESVWYLIAEIAAAVLVSCGIVDLFLEITLPRVNAKKNMLAEEYLKQILVNDNLSLMKAVNEMNCSAVKNAYMDENGNVCIQAKRYKYTFRHEEGALTLVTGKDSYKAALEKEAIAGCLLKFLSPQAPVNAYENARFNARLSNMKWILAGAALVSGVTAVLLMVQPDLMEGTNKYVRMVKSGCPEAYPDISYGDAFDAFFEDTSWEYFESDKGLDVVEFHGKCYREDEKINVEMQFVLDEEDGTFELYAVTIDDEPQMELTNGFLLLKIFESYSSEDGTKELTDDDINESKQSSSSEEKEIKQEDKQEEKQEEEQVDYAELGTDLSYPVMFLGYADGYSPCPVMVNEESAGAAKTGTYEEMTASLINDDEILYAEPMMYDKEIYTATKWDAPEAEWYDGLLSYDQFLSMINWMQDVHDVTGANNIYSGGSWDDVKMLAGRWNGGDSELAISIFSDFSYVSAYSEVGNITIGNESGTAYLIGTGENDVYVWCYMDNDGQIMLRYQDNGEMEAWFATEESGIESGTQFECVERFES